MDNSMLSLKYRGQNFDEMVGQKGIINEFKIRSLKNNFPQVMIFEGSSGSGKTTIGYILAKTINCHNPIILPDRRDACGKCPSCIDIQQESFCRDVKILDASSMGKEDVLRLEDSLYFAPKNDKNKIFIIDEAQELSKAGKGVFLKLLDKSIPNTYFILCTMDIDSFDLDVKSKGAIKSRAQIYKFRGVISEEVAKFLYEVLKKEGISESVPEIFITEGLFTIASFADGNVRAGLQYLDRCIVGGYYSSEDIHKEFGFIDKTKAIELLIKLLNKDKSFFKDLKKYEGTEKEFFYYSWKILLDAIIYKISGSFSDEEDGDWKKNSYSKINKTNLSALCRVYDSIFSASYVFKETIFWSKILVYYQTGLIEEVKNSISEESKSEITTVRPRR